MASPVCRGNFRRKPDLEYQGLQLVRDTVQLFRRRVVGLADNDRRRWGRASDERYNRSHRIPRGNVIAGLDYTTSGREADRALEERLMAIIEERTRQSAES